MRLVPNMFRHIVVPMAPLAVIVPFAAFGLNGVQEVAGRRSSDRRKVCEDVCELRPGIPRIGTRSMWEDLGKRRLHTGYSSKWCQPWTAS